MNRDWEDWCWLIGPLVLLLAFLIYQIANKEIHQFWTWVLNSRECR